MYVLCHRKSRPTGRKIARALGMIGRTKPVDALGVSIRWGSAQYPMITSQVQQADAIARAGNKLVAFQCFKRDGVPCPEFKMDITLSDIQEGEWFGRKTHGMCGRDIRVCGVVDYVPGTSDFYSKYIPNKREYRIHVFKNQILGVMGKYLDFPDQAGDGYIKNYLHGYRFRTPNKELKTDRTDAAVGAVKSLGLDFGAVDLLVGFDNKAYVLEVNTAPALASLTFDKYIAAFKKELGLE